MACTPVDTMTAPFTPPLGGLRAEPKRDRWGRYLLPDPRTGKERAWTRATTFAGAVKDTYNIGKWEKRLVAKGIAGREDLYMLAASTPLEDKSRLNKIADDAKEAARGSSGSNLGTALHAFAAYRDAGIDITVPRPWDADLAAYRAKLDAERIVIHREWIERMVLVPTFWVGGTFDRIVTLPDGRRLIADLKTGQDLFWVDIAVQLALYAYATHIIELETDQPVEMPKVDHETALVIHLPAGKARCELHEIDIVAGWETAYICKLVREWQARKNLVKPYNRLQEQASGQTSPLNLTDSIALATTREAVEELWRRHYAVWTSDLTQAAKARLAALQVPAGTTGGTREQEGAVA